MNQIEQFNLEIEQQEEIWKPVVNWEEFYEVSSLGRIRNKSNNKIRKLNCDKYGYFKIGLNNKVQKFKTVHRLVALAFIPNPENKPTVNHINGIKTDNRIDNLEWATISEQTKHAHKIKLINQEGERNPSSVITNEQATIIKQAKIAGKSCKDIAKEIGVNFHTAKHIYYNKTFIDV